ncbi:MAG: Flp pilus assembly protein TadG [Verrucomicrobiales bacterium]|jgi:Flp pilus assembly protein TadG
MKIRSLINAYKIRRQNQRGAIIVEAALAIPLLLLVILGSVEAGFAWEAKSATTSGVRTGLLRAASIGDKPETDMRIMQSIIGEIGPDNIAGVEYVMIFNAAGANDEATINSCALAIGGGGTSDQCVVYNNTTLQNVLASADPGAFQLANFDDGGNDFVNGAGNDDYACAAGALDSNWCAARRTVGGDAEIGVAVEYNHSWFTGIFPFSPPVFHDHTISSTFLADGSSITPTAVYAGPGSSDVYDSGSFNGPLNVGDVTWTGATDSDINSAPADPNRKFLGPFAQGQDVSVSVANLPAHTTVCISFDLYVIGTWDGPGSYGPDMFRVDIGVDGIFEHNQNYIHNDTTGASEEDTLGYSGVIGSGDMVVPLTVCQSGHTASTVNIEFSAVLTNASWTNESWGVDNVVISTS